MSPPPSTDDALAALLGQVLDDYAERLGRGERPAAEEYARRYPALAAVLRRTLPALEAARAPASADGPAAPGGRVPEGWGRLGDYWIVREVGRGGMGIVYEAEQVSLARRVALKVLPFAAALDARQLQRFKNEAQAAAQLHHTNIVPIYAVGCDQGVHYYAMQFIEGQSLAELIEGLRRGPGPAAGDLGTSLARPSGAGAGRAPALDPQATVPYSGPEVTGAETGRQGAAGPTLRSAQGPAYFRTVAHLGLHAATALEHAHGLGIVHRDVKPGNLLVDVRGNLWVTDFGLARAQGDGKLTLSGDVVGTLRYMSPEQALGRRGAFDHRTDVYSLGATLYELLTLGPVFAGRDRQDLLRQIACDEPRPPRRLNPAVPPELETVVLKAMAKAPEDRYATARELADDLRRFLEDQPVRAQRPTLAQRARRWARRHKPALRAAAAGLFLAAVGLAGSAALVQREQARTKAVEAAAATALAEKENEALERQEQLLYYQSIALAERARSAGQVRLAEQLLAGCQPSRRGWEWDYLLGLRNGRPPPLGHAGHLFCQAFSPDGRLLAVGASDGTVTLWDARARAVIRTLWAHKWWARSVAFSRDGRLLASGGWDGWLKVWDAGTGRLLWEREHDRRLDCVAFCSEGRCVASASQDGMVRLRDAASGAELRAWRAHEHQVYSVAFSPDGKYFATGSRDRTVKVWDTATWEVRHTLPEHVTQVLGVAFSPDSQFLASAGGDFYLKEHRGELKIWDVRTGRLRTLCGPTSSVFSVAFSPDGKRLASGGSEDPTVKLWDVATGQEALALRGHTDAIWGVAFSPDGRLLASASGDRTVRLWDGAPLSERPRAEAQRLGELAAGAVSVAFHPDGRRLATACQDGAVTLWDRPTGRPLHALRAPGASQLAFSPDGRLLAAATTEGVVWVWDADTGRERYQFHGDEVHLSLSFSPDSTRLAVACGRSVRIWSLADGGRVCSLGGHKNFIIGVALSPDGRHLASADFDGLVKVWDVAARREVRTLRAHAGRASCVAFSPDGKRLVSAGLDGYFNLWDTGSWEEPALPDLGASTVGLLGSPPAPGPLLAAGALFPGRCEKLLRPRGHGGHVHRVLFSPDGKYLVSGGSDATLRVWESATGRPLLAFRGHTDTIYDVACSPDGKHFASASLDRTVRLWDAQPPADSPARVASDPDR